MFYVCSHGVKIAVYDPNPHGRETVLLLHGWPMTHDLFEYQTGPLIQAGYRPVLLDLRGFGKSDAPALGYTYDDMAADLRSVIQTLHLSGVILVGYGMALSAQHSPARRRQKWDKSVQFSHFASAWRSRTA